MGISWLDVDESPYESVLATENPRHRISRKNRDTKFKAEMDIKIDELTQWI